MNILHITDFHYSNESSLQNKVVQAIVNAIKKENVRIDFVFFTGDLVQNGSNSGDFARAQTVLFDELINKLNVQKDNIIFCAGNHDIDRNSIHPATKSYFDANINTEEKLDDFYSKKSDMIYADTIKPTSNFKNFLSSFHFGENNIVEDLYSIHFRKINNEQVGIVCLNSAWLSAIDKDKTGNDDKGNLMIPNSLLTEIKKKVINTNKKIILIHHPLYFLKDFNFYGIENIIHNEYDLMFSGHVHKVSSVSRYSGSNGIFEHVAKASLSAKENLGCTLIELSEIEENKIIVREISYINESSECHIGNDIIHTIPCGIEKQKTIAFRKKLFDKIIIEKENSSKLLLLRDDEENKDFLTLYNNPVLKKESEGGFDSKNVPIIKFDEIIESPLSYCILGKDKCGKTSLLKKIQLEYLINYSKNSKVPFFFDAKEYESKLDDKFELEQLIRSYFEINKEKVNELLSSDAFLLLVDNYSTNSGIATYLNNFLTQYPKIRYIICTEYNLTRSVDLFQLGDSIPEKLYFHDLRRQEIVLYTERRLSSNQKKEEVQEKIIQLCKQLELPLNYWTVSLLLLIHTKSSNTYSKNLFSILDVCVDEIFGKKQLLIERSRVSFDQLKSICANLAKFLFENCEKNIYSATSDIIIKVINDYISENDRISAKGKDIFNFFLNCGMLKEKENDLYVFRLNGFFEYFLALQMTRENDFKESILLDEGKFLAFKNQLEIYSGFKRDDFDFLNAIYIKTCMKLNPIFAKYDKNKDEELLIRVKEPEKIEDKCRELSVQRTLTTLEKAKIEDVADELNINSEVHLIQKINPNNINSELIERYLSILARVYKNSDDIKGNREKLTEIFKIIIDNYCNLGFYIVEEFAQITNEEISVSNDIDLQDFPELDLLRFISNFSPFLSQSLLFDGLGHYNLEQKIKKEIEQLELNVKENQYKLYMLYFLLLDTDLSTNKEYIQKAIDNIKMPLLKYSIFLKLNYYLAFKVGKNKSMQQELSNNIQQAKLNLDKKADIGEIQRNIQERKRLSLIAPNQ
jgi:predicted MPP superfamily phosphohydrolase/predicted site-specific integrase-resolvase